MGTADDDDADGRGDRATVDDDRASPGGEAEVVASGELGVMTDRTRV